MRETWYCIITEFKALGVHCVAHGPEFWLVVPLAVGVAAFAALAGWDIWKGE